MTHYNHHLYHQAGEFAIVNEHLMKALHEKGLWSPVREYEIFNVAL
jgi:hypothetical protein